MKSSIIAVVVAVILGLILFGFGFLSAIPISKWELSETLLGTFAGGLIALLAMLLNGLMSRETSISAIRTQAEIEDRRQREADETKSAREFLNIMDSMCAYESGFTAGSNAGIIPLTNERDRLRTKLATLTSGAFPELDDVVSSYTLEVLRVTLILAKHSRLNPDQRAAAGEQSIDLWDKAGTYQRQIRNYIVERFIRRTEVEIPTSGRIELLHALVQQQRRA